MKSAIRHALLALVLLLSPFTAAFAALTTYGNANDLTINVEGVGDLIVVSGESTSASVSFADGVNTYATPVVVGPDEYGSYYALSWAKSTSTGLITVTETGTGVSRNTIFAITGFVHGPVVIPGDTSSVVVTGDSLVTPGFTTTKNNEFAVGVYGTNGDTPTINSTDYTTISEDASYRIAATAALSTDGYSSGTSLVFNATVAGSGAAALIQGFYDGVPGPTGSAAYVPGAQFSQFITVTASESLAPFMGGTYRIECNASGGAVTVTLPTAIGNFSAYELVKTDSSGNACSFATTSSQTINGTTPTTITSQWGKQAIASDNANWVMQ